MDLLNTPRAEQRTAPDRNSSSSVSRRRWLRPALVRLHRWFGLGAALFLGIAGLTGALISWDHELDAWLNPDLFQARSTGPALPVPELVARIEAAHPQAQVSYHPLAVAPGQTFIASVEPRPNPATGQPYPLDYNQIALDPASGAEQGRRLWGAVSLERHNLLPFLYKLHYSLHLPESGGVAWGVWLMGLIAIAWVVDTLIAFALSFPQPAQWRRSFTLRWSAGGYRRVFDLHRSGGVWLFGLVGMMAVTSVAMNLNHEVMRPLVAWFSPLSPSPQAAATAPPAPGAAPLSRWVVLQQAQAHAQRLGWPEPAGALWRNSATGVWGVGFFTPGHDHGDGGLGNHWLYLDAHSGDLLATQVPGQGSAGDVFLQSMFPLHSGRILGLPGRVLISLLGLAIAGLSVTGVMIWWRKRRGQALRGPSAPGSSGAGSA